MHAGLMSVELFYYRARAFCNLIENTSHYGHKELQHLVSALALLYSEANRLILCDLDEVDDEQQPPSVKQTEREVIVNRVTAALHQDYYRVVDPLNIYESPAPTMSQISDDLTDIWQELTVGLRLWERGNAKDRRLAQWHWAFSFSFHWGLHAVNAITYMHHTLARMH